MLETKEIKEFAFSIAKEAGEIMRANFCLGMKKEWKKDNSLLTETDLTINQLVIDQVAKCFPTYSVIAEEGCQLVTDSQYTWVCDPLDGTTAFAHGIPNCVFSLALVHQGTPQFGVVYDPFIDRLFWAQKGEGAFCNENPISVSDATTFEHQLIGLELPARLPYRFPGLRTALLQKKRVRVLTLGSAVYEGMLVGCGELIASILTGVKPDVAALKIIVEEAGGKMTDIFGNEQRYDQDIQGSVISNGRVHDELIGLIQESLVRV